MRVLKLTLKKKWFDLIAAGIKKEEYRERKEYWIARLLNYCPLSAELVKILNTPSHIRVLTEVKPFDAIEFRNGYGENKPTLLIEYNSLSIGTGSAEWGATAGEYYFVLHLGEIISKSNF